MDRRKLQAIIGWSPIVMISIIICWGYYAYIYQLCFKIVEDQIVRIVYLIMAHILLLLFLWSYWKTVLTPLADVPEMFSIPEDIKELFVVEDLNTYKTAVGNFIEQRKLPIFNRFMDGGPRYCIACGIVKPDRSHHCSVCRKCILKFDHHCPMVNTCINYKNLKFFLLFLGYAFCLCIFVVSSATPPMVIYIRDKGITKDGLGKINVPVLVFFAICFSVASGFMLIYHLYLVSKNRTTNETFGPPIFGYGVDKSAYDLGMKRNFREVFGANPCLWLIPVFSSRGSGLTFQTKEACIDQYSSLLEHSEDHVSLSTSKENVSDSHTEQPIKIEIV